MSTPRKPTLSRLQHAMFCPVAPGVAAALLDYKAWLRFGGWTPAQAEAELQKLSTTKGNRHDKH